ncbi:carbohydrate porin [Roseomonas sp. OT10]|uniref:carbohydrate porin n=1 Tax=Roseomonas cutis TaxID=2897332 RepID=UPI001E4FF09B|nr:carbohydrate porin [Roseomonas sp. OT10]UFN50878.1 carbohydrate porin [Roseomonas sp. OT10]
MAQAGGPGESGSRGRQPGRALVAFALLLLPATPRAETAGPEADGTDCAEEALSIGRGTCLSASVIAESFANLQGGLRRGITGLGRGAAGLNVDLGAATRSAALAGWSLQATAFAIYGRQPSATLTGSLEPVSNAEALSTLRLSELWLERRFGGAGSLRFGQLTADSEFFIAQAASGFVGGTFGWPASLATALPSGGPAYPLAAPGVRVALGDPEEGSGLRLGVYGGDPGGRHGPDTDPQRHNRYGTTFSTAGGAFLILEGVVGAPAPGQGRPRPWVARLGGWVHTGRFDDLRRDDGSVAGGSGLLADPASSGVPRRHAGNQGAYAVGEVTAWRSATSDISLFARISAAPGDRNPLAFYADGGLAWHGPVPGRPQDLASLGIAYARTGGAGRAADRDRNALAGLDLPVRDGELTAEANYDLSLRDDRFHIQPVVQWIRHPGAGIPDERSGEDRRLRDALVLGLRLRARL